MSALIQQTQIRSLYNERSNIFYIEFFQQVFAMGVYPGYTNELFKGAQAKQGDGRL